jgi:hypothetical protein
MKTKKNVKVSNRKCCLETINKHNIYCYTIIKSIIIYESIEKIEENRCVGGVVGRKRKLVNDFKTTSEEVSRIFEKIASNRYVIRLLIE